MQWMLRTRLSADGNKEEAMEKAKAIIRLLVQVILMINMILTAAGKNPIPIDESQLTEFLTYFVTGLGTVWIWWKNNNLTEAAQYAQETLEVLKSEPTDDGEQGAE